MENTARTKHPVRGSLAAIVFGVPMVFFGFNAADALAHQFIAGWLPSQWFSDNAADWLFAMGNKGGAADYIVFMVNSVLSYGCWWIIRWGFTNQTK